MSSAEGVLTDTDVARAILNSMLNFRRCRDQLLGHKPANTHMIACMPAMCMISIANVLQIG